MFIIGLTLVWVLFCFVSNYRLQNDGSGINVKTNKKNCQYPCFNQWISKIFENKTSAILNPHINHIPWRCKVEVMV